MSNYKLRSFKSNILHAQRDGIFESDLCFAYNRTHGQTTTKASPTSRKNGHIDMSFIHWCRFSSTLS